MDSAVDIISGPELRRRWSVQDKLRLVAETHEPGTMIRTVAARHGVCESLLFTWRRQMRDGVLSAVSEKPVFLPVHMIDAAQTTITAPPAPMPCSTSPARRGAPSGLIEIQLGNGQQIRVGSDVNLEALRRVLAALRA